MVEVTGHDIGVGMAWRAIEGERVAEAQPQAPIIWLLQVTIKRLDWMEIVKLIHTVHRLSAIGLAPSCLQNPIPGPSPSLQAPKPQTSEPRVAHLLPVPRCSLSSLAIPYQQTAFCAAKQTTLDPIVLQQAQNLGTLTAFYCLPTFQLESNFSSINNAIPTDRVPNILLTSTNP